MLDFQPFSRNDCQSLNLERLSLSSDIENLHKEMWLKLEPHKDTTLNKTIL